jgi:hypothetical protein
VKISRLEVEGTTVFRNVRKCWTVDTASERKTFKAGWYWEYSQYHPAPDSTRSPKCIKCTNAVVRLRNSWWWAERLPETCRVEIPIIKLELSAPVGFIRKESITMHGHTIPKI